MPFGTVFRKTPFGLPVLNVNVPPVREKKSSVCDPVGMEDPLGPTNSVSRFTGDCTWNCFKVTPTVEIVPGKFVTVMFDGFGLAGPMSSTELTPAGMTIPLALQ